MLRHCVRRLLAPGAIALVTASEYRIGFAELRKYLEEDGTVVEQTLLVKREGQFFTSDGHEGANRTSSTTLLIYTHGGLKTDDAPSSEGVSNLGEVVGGVFVPAHLVPAHREILSAEAAAAAAAGLSVEDYRQQKEEEQRANLKLKNEGARKRAYEHARTKKRGLPRLFAPALRAITLEGVVATLRAPLGLAVFALAVVLLLYCFEYPASHVYLSGGALRSTIRNRCVTAEEAADRARAHQAEFVSKKSN